MTGLDIAQALKDEIRRLEELMSYASRRRNILRAAATKLRMGYAPDVALAEIRAAGEEVPIEVTES